MAVCLRLAAGGSVAGVGESALRALSKLDQVMPSRLRSQVSAVHDATVTLTWNSSDSPVEPDVLMTLARACRDREHVSASYVDRAGNATAAAARAVSARHDGKALVSAGVRPRPPGLAQPAAGPDARRAGARQHVRRQGCARRRGLRAAVDQRVAVPARRARPLFRTRTCCGAALLAVIGDDRSRTGPTPASSQRAPTTRSGWCSTSRRSAPTSRCSNHPKWPTRSSRSPSGCGARRAGRDVRAWPRIRASAGAAAAVGGAPRSPSTAGPTSCASRLASCSSVVMMFPLWHSGAEGCRRHAVGCDNWRRPK